MKRLFFFLLLVNLGLAGWGYFLAGPKAVPLPRLTGANLQLLSERDAPVAKPGPRGYDLEQLAPDRSVQAQHPAPAGQPAVPASEAPTGAPSAPAQAKPAAPSAPAAVPAAVAAAEPPAEPDDQAKVLKCHTLGAFDKREDAEQVASQLASLSVAAILREDVTQRQNGFWVLIPPLPSHDAARAMENRLRDAGIADIWRFIKGDLENAVSLGMFTRREAAERRKAQIVASGFPAEVRPRYTESDELWLDFPADTRVNAAALKRRFAHDFPDLQLLDRECVRVKAP